VDAGKCIVREFKLMQLMISILDSEREWVMREDHSFIKETGYIFEVASQSEVGFINCLNLMSFRSGHVHRYSIHCYL